MAEFDLLEGWLEALRGELDLTGLEGPDVAQLLAAVRSIAHTVSHPAGPVAAFAAGYAAARGGGSAMVVADAIERTVRLAQNFEAEDV
ncbi:MAG: DUF6457 domain-containing protein [Propionibacteriaceae bacterium]|jgi:hypothetical protein|nr:DUF6457 domain-containing protein [Propionibacteriaceae bacterium]